MPITQMIFAENNPAGIKAVLSGLGIAKPHVRLPLVEATENLQNLINNELSSLGRR
jgi:4-hydroxy-tetrahydrodipicolinate synthase